QLRAARGTEHQAQDDLSRQGAQPESRSGREARCMSALTRRVLGALALTSVVTLAGCARGCTSSSPPIHLNPSMDDQPKVLTQTSSTFFFNGSSMRDPVPGTVALDGLREDGPFFTGKGADGQFVATMPVTNDAAL